ncbi:MAG: co-chaperone GroES, partial [Firmicutes bacterium]|nr:co-chaperone GroES [Bacillota bacterium]
AEVVAVGPGTEEEPMEVKVGDTVVFSKYGGTDIKHEGEELTIMRQSDILAVIE